LYSDTYNKLAELEGGDKEPGRGTKV